MFVFNPESTRMVLGFLVIAAVSIAGYVLLSRILPKPMTDEEIVKDNASYSPLQDTFVRICLGLVALWLLGVMVQM